MKDLASNSSSHGIRTPNEGINRKNLKFWADVADEIWDWGLIFGRAVKAISSPGVRSPRTKTYESKLTYYVSLVRPGQKENSKPRQRYTYRVLQTIQMKLILLWVWAARLVTAS